jgi:TIR domain/HEAT repeats
MEIIPVFLSHITEDKALAGYLQTRIRRDFLGAIEVFVSSDGVSIEAGSDWLQSLHSALDRAKCVIVLCSSQSVTRPWVNFEVGAAWLKGLPIMPLCHSGLEPAQLKPPFSLLQGGSLAKSETLHSLYVLLSRLSGLAVPEVDFEQMVRDMAGMASADVASIESPMPSVAADSPELVLRRVLSGEVTSLHEAALSQLPGAYEALTKVATSAFDDQIRAEAISALGDLRDPRTIEFVSQMLLKSKFPVSKACARVLSNLKDPSTVPVLIKAMRLEVEWMSSQAAVEALAEFAPNLAQQICPALVEALGQGSFVAESAKQGLVQYGAAAEPTLLAVLENPDADIHVGMDVVDILGLVGEQSAVPALQAFSKRLRENPELGGTDRLRIEQSVASALKRLAAKTKEAASS